MDQLRVLLLLTSVLSSACAHASTNLSLDVAQTVSVCMLQINSHRGSRLHKAQSSTDGTALVESASLQQQVELQHRFNTQVYQSRIWTATQRWVDPANIVIMLLVMIGACGIVSILILIMHETAEDQHGLKEGINQGSNPDGSVPDPQRIPSRQMSKEDVERPPSVLLPPGGTSSWGIASVSSERSVYDNQVPPGADPGNWGPQPRGSQSFDKNGGVLNRLGLPSCC